MKKKDSLTTQGLVLLGLLIVQYLLGIVTTFFIKFPEGENTGQLWEFAWKQIPLAAHIILGSLLIIGAIVLIIRSIRHKNKSWIIASAVGYLGIQIAAFAGAQFISLQSELYSFVMAITFIVALLSYSWGIYKAAKT